MGRSHAKRQRLPAVAPAREAAVADLIDVTFGDDHADHLVDIEGLRYLARLVRLPEDLGGEVYLLTGHLGEILHLSLLRLSDIEARGRELLCRECRRPCAWRAAQIISTASQGRPVIQPLEYVHMQPDTGSIVLSGRDGVLVQTTLLHATQAGTPTFRHAVGVITVPLWRPGALADSGPVDQAPAGAYVICLVCRAPDDRLACGHATMLRRIVEREDARTFLDAVLDEIATTRLRSTSAGERGHRTAFLPSGVELETRVSRRGKRRYGLLRVWAPEAVGGTLMLHASQEGSEPICTSCMQAGRGQAYLADAHGRCPEVRILDACDAAAKRGR